MYTIYRITDGRFSYIGMTKQSLSRRLSQHKADSTGGCSVTKKMCKKEKPSDLAQLHKHLRARPQDFRIVKLKEVSGPYLTAHAEELRIKGGEGGGGGAK